MGIAAIFSEEYRFYIIALYPIAVILYLLSSYINKIEKHEEEIKRMNEKLKIHERLSRLEGRIFK